MFSTEFVFRPTLSVINEAQIEQLHQALDMFRGIGTGGFHGQLDTLLLEHPGAGKEELRLGQGFPAGEGNTSTRTGEELPVGDQFSDQFTLLARHMDQVLREAQQLEEALANNSWTPEEAAQRMQELREQARQLAGNMAAIADDFAAFDLENELKQTATELAATIGEGEAAADGEIARELHARLKAILEARTLFILALVAEVDG